MDSKMLITPKTRIIDLITGHPELEAVLIQISPAFRKLENPVLRRTVARVTNLQQAALVGGLKVEDLVNRLREAAGLEIFAPLPGTGEESGPAGETPQWFDPDVIRHHLDAREMLNRGEHPVGQVLADLHDMPAGDIYELVAPFYPAPLIDKAAGIGFSSHSVQLGPEEYYVYFMRK